MRIIYLDLDSLRPDHLGCYGYHRATSPNLDTLAKRGVVFEQCYCSDSPCLPSRTALMSGRFGIHTGAVTHGGTGADFRLEGVSRRFRSRLDSESLPGMLRAAGYRTASISPFAERHGAWWFNAGFHEVINSGRMGMESAEEVSPVVIDWLERNGRDDDWFLHVNFWDPHMPARAPVEAGEPFAGGSASGVADRGSLAVDKVDSGRTSRHREGASHHLPLIVIWPGAAAGSRDRGLRYHLDLGPTIAELLGVDAPAIWDGSSYAAALGVGATPRGSAASGSGPRAARSEAVRSKAGGGQSAPSWVERLDACHDPATGWDELVLSQCAGACQRSVRFERWLYLRTYHDGFNLYPRELLFDVEADPHECTNLSASHPDVVRDAVFRLDRWHEAMMATMAHPYAEDPLWRVIAEGGPSHVRGSLPAYLERLESRGEESDCR